MLPNRIGQVNVRANFDAAVELKVRKGERVGIGQALVTLEGDKEIEQLAARSPAVVVEVHVKEGDEVPKGTLLLVLQEDPPN